MNRLKVTVQQAHQHPLWWRTFVGNRFKLDAGQRVINEQKITIEDDPGTAVYVFGSWQPYAVDVCEYEQHQEQKRKEAEEEQANRDRMLKEQAEEAKLFNKSLSVPVKWTVEIKEVLSGLSASSWGNGQKRNTVYHIFLQERLSAGRLTREAGDFLCTSIKAKYRGNWSGSLGAGDYESHKVTCKSCLKIAERFKIK